MKKILLFYFILVSGSLLYSQNSFDFTYPQGISTGFIDTFEDTNHHYISIGGTAFDASNTTFPTYVKLDSEGNILKDTVFIRQDTCIYPHYGYQKANGNYMIFGGAAAFYEYHKVDLSYFCELSQEFDLIWEKFTPIPTPYHYHRMLNFVHEPDSSLLIMGKADSSYQGFNDNLFVERVNKEGEVLQFKFYEGWSTYGVYDCFIPNFDSSGYVMTGSFTGDASGTLREWIELDENLEIVDYAPYIDMYHLMDGAGARWLANGNLFVVSQEGQHSPPSTDIYVRILTSGLETIVDTIIDPGDYKFSPPSMNSVDFITEDNIWTGSFIREPPTSGLMENFYFYIFDAEGNVKGLREYGGDLGYWMFNLRATSDGGCIMTGRVGQSVGASLTNGYVIKVMPEDVLSEIKENSPDKNTISVYPCPFDESLSFGKVKIDQEVLLMDSFGRVVIRQKMDDFSNTKIETSNLKQGFYYYLILENGKVMQTGKLSKI